MIVLVIDSSFMIPLEYQILSILIPSILLLIHVFKCSPSRMQRILYPTFIPISSSIVLIATMFILLFLITCSHGSLNSIHLHQCIIHGLDPNNSYSNTFLLDSSPQHSLLSPLQTVSTLINHPYCWNRHVSPIHFFTNSC